MYSERVRKLRKKLKKEKLESFLICKAQNCRYLSGFTGSFCFLLITEDEQYLFTDFRYISQAKEETKGFKIVLIQEPIWTNLAAKIRETRINSVGFEAHSLTFAQYNSLSKEITALDLRPLRDIVEELRIVKNRREIGKIKQAVRIADMALENILSSIKPGVIERDIAIELDYQIKRYGAESAAFEVIVAAGERSALPHARPTNKRLKSGDLVLIDIGARFEGYNSDMTRVLALGRISKEKECLYKTVYEAQNRALAAIISGKCGAEVDAVARKIISQAGWAEFFGHGTGHGVGLEVHEAPFIGINRKDVLKPGMVFTIEPAVYLPGLGGVRIEDSVFLGENGIEELTKSSKELLVL